MTTVAEGVETQAQLEHLLREGCDESQGYLHSRPLPREDFEKWLIRARSASAGASDIANGAARATL
jgi:EAL domain-containing protein (putative c-di-GMP-specific phosphodiesterase class I)